MAERVLVVDDDFVSRTVLGQLLRRRGFEVVEAADVREAVALGSSEGIVAVFCDYQLPDGTGSAVASALRGSGRTVPFVLVSGLVDGPDGDPVAADVDDRLAKPVSTSRLDDCLVRLGLGHPPR